MSTLRKIAKDIIKEEELDSTPGAYPIIFKDDWTRVKFILLLRCLKVWHKVRKLFASLPRLFLKIKKSNRGELKSRGLSRQGRGVK